MNHRKVHAEILDCGLRIADGALAPSGVRIPHSAFRNRGQMLLVVLWAMGLVSLGVGGVAMYSAHELRLGRIPLQQLQRRAAAQAAVYQAIRIVQQDTQDTPAIDTFQEPWATGRSATDTELFQHIPVGEGAFSIGYDEQGVWVPGLIDEERKLNLNTASPDQLKRLIELVLPGEADAQTVANAIIDWRTPGEPVGAPCQGSTPPCHKGSFESLDEVRLVPGISAELYTAMKPYVTIYGTGAVNVNTAPAIVLNALGCPGESLVQQRQPDAHGPFPSPPADCSGGTVTSTVFTVPVIAEVHNATGSFHLHAVIDRSGCGPTPPEHSRCVWVWSS